MPAARANPPTRRQVVGPCAAARRWRVPGRPRPGRGCPPEPGPAAWPPAPEPAPKSHGAGPRGDPCPGPRPPPLAPRTPPCRLPDCCFAPPGVAATPPAPPSPGSCGGQDAGGQIEAAGRWVLGSVAARPGVSALPPPPGCEARARACGGHRLRAGPGRSASPAPRPAMASCSSPQLPAMLGRPVPRPPGTPARATSKAGAAAEVLRAGGRDASGRSGRGSWGSFPRPPRKWPPSGWPASRRPPRRRATARLHWARPTTGRARPPSAARAIDVACAGQLGLCACRAAPGAAGHCPGRGQAGRAGSCRASSGSAPARGDPPRAIGRGREPPPRTGSRIGPIGLIGPVGVALEVRHGHRRIAFRPGHLHRRRARGDSWPRPRSAALGARQPRPRAASAPRRPHWPSRPAAPRRPGPAETASAGTYCGQRRRLDAPRPPAPRLARPPSPPGSRRLCSASGSSACAQW